jgi:hypothetical protein
MLLFYCLGDIEKKVLSNFEIFCKALYHPQPETEKKTINMDSIYRTEGYVWSQYSKGQLNQS